MNLTQVEYFLATADKLNFTEAANRCFVSQPALSKQIAKLEDELGVKLFVRNSKKVELTEAGLQLQKDLKEIVKQVESAKLNAQRVGKQKMSHLKICCFDGYVEDFLPQMVNRIKEERPDLDISISRNTFTLLMENLNSGKADLVFTLDGTVPDSEMYESKEIIVRPVGIYYSKKLIGADLSNEVYYVNKRYSEKSKGLLEDEGITPKEIIIVDDYLTILTYLKLGGGFAVFGANALQHEDDLVLRELKSRKYDQMIIAIWEKGNTAVGNLMKDIKL